MKYRFLALTVILLMLLSITVNAQSYEYTVSTGNNFITTQTDDNLTAISGKLNTTPSELESYLSKNNIIYIAVSHDNKSQIKITALSDNFSTMVGDIANINDATMTKFVAALSPNNDSITTTVENNGRKYVCIKTTSSDENGNPYTITQYVTICNNKTFYFSCNNPGQDTSSEIITVFKSFKLVDTTPQKDEVDWRFITINCCVVIFGIGALALAASLVITHFKKSAHTEDLQDDEVLLPNKHQGGQFNDED